MKTNPFTVLRVVHTDLQHRIDESHKAVENGETLE